MSSILYPDIWSPFVYWSLHLWFTCFDAEVSHWRDVCIVMLRCGINVRDYLWPPRSPLFIFTSAAAYPLLTLHTRSPITNTDRNSEGETERTWLQLLFRRVEEGTSKRWSKLNSKRTRYLGKLSQHRTQNNNLTTNTICLKLPQHFLCVFNTRDSEGRMELRCLR